MHLNIKMKQIFCPALNFRVHVILEFMFCSAAALFGDQLRLYVVKRFCFNARDRCSIYSAKNEILLMMLPSHVENLNESLIANHLAQKYCSGPFGKYSQSWAHLLL